MRGKYSVGQVACSILLIVAACLLLARLMNIKHEDQPCAHPVASSAIAQSSMIRPHLCQIPTYTADDARQYVNTHPFTDIDMTSIGQPVAAKIAFMTNAELDMMFHNGYTHSYPNSIICYVELRGIFTFSSLAGSRVMTKAYEVFDGVTGVANESGGSTI